MNRRKLTACIMSVFLCVQLSVNAEALSDESIAQIQAAIVLAENDMKANEDSIKILINQCLEQVDPGDPAANTLKSIVTLLDTGNADAMSVTVLLKSLIDGQQESGQQNVDSEQQTAEPSAKEQEASAAVNQSSFQEPSYVSSSGLPVYEAASYVKTIISHSVLVDVPGNWGNNASGGALTSYSPVNDSGAVSPAAGTLKFSYFPMEGADESSAFDNYEDSIDQLSVTQGLTSEDASAAALPARKLDYIMSIGANQFTCETICFAYDRTMYTIEMWQGQQTEYDYFPLYNNVVDSAEIGDESELTGTEDQISEPYEETSQDENDPVPAQPGDESQNSENTNSGEGNTGGSSSIPGDIGTFMYDLNGHVYQFPTAVQNMMEEDLMLDRQKTLPYDFKSDADMAGGRWTEITNTQYYTYQDSQYCEMVGVTNINGYPSILSEGIVTVLLDTRGNSVSLTLPGGIRVGSSESDIPKGFPEFAGMGMDGIGRFRGNELLYACNIRPDGTNGYAIMKNNAPYFSAISIICDHGEVIEIKMECVGSVRAEGIFL